MTRWSLVYEDFQLEQEGLREADGQYVGLASCGNRSMRNPDR